MPLDDPHIDESTKFKTMSFGDHLDELRTRVIRALIFPIPIAVITWFFSVDLINLIRLPLHRALRGAGLNDQLLVLSPIEAMMTQIKISLLAAAIISAPWIFWQVWLFVRPGLYNKERRFVYFLIPGSAILTFAGVALLYFVMLPLVLMVLINFGVRLDDQLSFDALRNEDSIIDRTVATQLETYTGIPANAEIGDIWLSPEHELVVVVAKERGYDPDHPPLDENGTAIPPALEVRRIPLVKSSALSQQFQLSAYVSFVLMLTLGMVIGFQTPLVVLLLGWLDLVRIEFLQANRKYAFFGCAVLGAVLTPADPGSMLAMMIPLYLLFELGILLLRFFPAARVAEGTLFTRPGKRASSEKQTVDPAQSERPEHSADFDQPAPTEQDESTDQSDQSGDAS